VSLLVAILLVLSLWSMYSVDYYIPPTGHVAGYYTKEIPTGSESEQEFPISKSAATQYIVEYGLNLSAPTGFVTQPMDSPDILEMDQLDPRLWEHIKSNHITPPSTLPYLFTKESKAGYVDANVDKIHFEMFKSKVSDTWIA